MYRIECLGKKIQLIKYKKKLDNDINELFAPLFTVAPSEEIRKKILKFAMEEQRNRKEESSSTKLALILESIIEVHRVSQKDLIPIASIKDYVNRDEDDPKEMITSQQVGYMTKVLGFVKRKGTHGIRCILWNEAIVKRLSEQFGIEGGEVAAFLPTETHPWPGDL